MENKIKRCIAYILCNYQNYANCHAVEIDDIFGITHKYINCSILSRYISVTAEETKSAYDSLVCDFIIDGLFCRVNEFIATHGIHADLSHYDANFLFLFDTQQNFVIDTEVFDDYLEDLKKLSISEFQTFGKKV